MPHLSVDRTRTTMLAALGVAVLAWLAAWVATPLADPVRTGALDVLWAAVSGLAGAGALLAARMPGNEPCRRSLVFAGLGILAWACGQLAWTWYDLTRPEPPYPSLADVGYVLSLPLLAAALVAWPATARRFSRDDVLDAGLLGAAVVVCGVVLVIVPIFETHASDTLGLLYPSADILLVAAAAVALAFRGFAERGRLGLFALGMLALVAADAGYAFDAAGRYATGTAFYEAGWTLAFGILGLAVLLPPGAALRLRAPRGVVPVLVVALLGAAGTYQVLDELERGDTGHLVAVALIDALLLVLAIRQMALARTRERESRRLAELTGRLEREAALRTATLQLSRSGVCVLDGSRELAFANDAWIRVGSTAFGAVADRVLQGKPALHEHGGRVLSFSSTRLASGETVVSVDDVTDERRERETRDRFLAEVVRAQDLEARRIAERLHDDAVQQLTAVSMRLELAAMQRSDQTLELLALEVGRITASLRRLLVDLHPVVLESQGLAAAIETAAAGPRALGIDVHVEPFEHRFGPELEHLAYRLVQEALANVLKHARATRVEIVLELENGLLRGRVEDDGVGVDEGAVAGALRRGSLGLHLVRERTELAGGSFGLARREEGGSRFSFEVPVADGAAGTADEREDVHA